jgi:hypothetical protein
MVRTTLKPRGSRTARKNSSEAASYSLFIFSCRYLFSYRSWHGADGIEQAYSFRQDRAAMFPFHKNNPFPIPLLLRLFPCQFMKKSQKEILHHYPPKPGAENPLRLVLVSLSLSP